MKKAVVAGIFVLLFAGFAQASVVYSFSGTYTELGTGIVIGPVVFTATVPSAVLVDATFVPGPQLTCDACIYIDFIVDAVAHGLTTTPSNAIAYGVVGGLGYLFYFDPNSFTVDGVYTDVIGSGFPNQGTLTVSGASSVPEPSSLLLMCTGIFGLAGAVRRRFMP